MKKNQSNEESPKLNRYVEWMLQNDILAVYIDIIIRALIGLCVGIILYIIMMRWIGLSFVFSFIIIFLIIIALNPLLNKIKIGYAIQRRYFEFLMKYV